MHTCLKYPLTHPRAWYQLQSFHLLLRSQLNPLRQDQRTSLQGRAPFLLKNVYWTSKKISKDVAEENTNDVACEKQRGGE